MYYVNQGDSGGPSYVNDVQVGIVSYGSETDCTKGNVYTKVSDFAGWIKSKIVTTTPAPPMTTAVVGERGASWPGGRLPLFLLKIQF